jgi:putative FmdB family regulatory protein
MPLYDFECQECEHRFEYLAMNNLVRFATCPKCGEKCKKVFSAEGQTLNFTYNPKTDICDWGGNTSQYYRLYNEAKDRGENVRLPDEGE